MRTSWSHWVVLLVAVALAACSEAEKPAHQYDAGYWCVQRAAAASIPGAREAPTRGNSSESQPGAGVHGGDGRTFGTLTRIARFDWSALIAEAPFGIAGLVLDQAEAHERVLREAGFEPLVAGASTFDSDGAPAEFAVSISHSIAGSSGGTGWSTPRDLDRVEHRRVYHAPRSGAFVVARIDYDGRDHTVCAELTYVESTVNAEYPAFEPKFSETVTQMPRKR